MPGAYVSVMRRMEAIGGNPVLRMAKAKAGPVVTDNGNFILDVDFGEIHDPIALHKRMKLMVGVVETGIFARMAERAYFGRADGNVEEWTPKGDQA